jgi:hypothetical protein
MLDGNVVYQGNKDLLKDIFNGNSKVIWGFTASTGRKYNLQYFCLRRLAQYTGDTGTTLSNLVPIQLTR